MPNSDETVDGVACQQACKWTVDGGTGAVIPSHTALCIEETSKSAKKTKSENACVSNDDFVDKEVGGFLDDDNRKLMVGCGCCDPPVKESSWCSGVTSCFDGSDTTYLCVDDGEVKVDMCYYDQSKSKAKDKCADPFWVPYKDGDFLIGCGECELII